MDEHNDPPSDGFLTRDQREYLRAKATGNRSSTDAAVETEITRHLGGAVTDFVLAFDYLDDRTLARFFEERADDGEFLDGIEAMLSLGYWGLKESEEDPIEVLENAIEVVENAITPLDRAVSIFVSCNVSKEVADVDISDLLASIDTDDPLELMDDLAMLGVVEIDESDANNRSVTFALTDQYTGTFDEFLEALDGNVDHVDENGHRIVLEQLSPRKVQFTAVDE